MNIGGKVLLAPSQIFVHDQASATCGYYGAIVWPLRSYLRAVKRPPCDYGEELLRSRLGGAS